jgi:dynein heavy chain
VFAEKLEEMARVVLLFSRNTDLTKVNEIYVEVKKVLKMIKDAEDKASLINNREALFGFPKTEYSNIAKISKDFDPFAKLWATAYQKHKLPILQEV